MIIDATNLILGRMATYAAKTALLGEEVIIVHAEKAYVSGDRRKVLTEYMRRKRQGTWAKGPFIHRSPDRFVRRTIRGMLPYKQPKGREAFKRIMCYIGLPEEFKDKELVSFKHCQVSKLPSNKYLSVLEICRHLGGKV
ncbi:MAG: 50S ribosomal protein L13 [Nanoarchaeota archaeon]